MEDLLQQIVKEARNSKLFALEKAAQDACDFLDKQQGLLRDPPYELRAKCLRAIQLTLETRRGKFVAFGLTGLHRMLRDDRFQSPYEPEDDSLWLPAQMLHAMGSILSQPDDAQTDMLKVLLQVACCPYWTMNGRLIIATLTTCCEAFEHGNQAVKTAAQAATSQTLRSFCLFLDEECREMDENARRNKNVRERGVSCFNEALPILQYICCKLDEAQNARNGSTVVFLLECLHTLISSLPAKIHTNCHFTTFLWQKFCPALIGFLGTPRVDKSFQSREHQGSAAGAGAGGRNEPTELGRGSGYLATSLGFDSHQAKTVYCIGTELVRIVGCVGPLRPVLESVFHRMLLYPPPQQRLESLKALKELLRSPSRIADFAGPLLVDDDKSSQLQSDMALMRLAMDSIEESTSGGGLAVLQASVSCVVALLSALQELCDGKAISHEYTCAINTLYEDLESCDYRGPLTYQSMARLPKTYREQLELMKKTQKATDSDSSGRGPSEEEEEDDDDDDVDGNSTDTEGPPTDEQTTASTVADNDTASVQIEDSSDSYDLANERERERLEKLPKCLHVGRQFVEECNVDVERHNARMFVKTLKQDLIPQVLGLRSIIEVDEALQNFASRYCQGVYAAQQRLREQEENRDNRDDCALITIMNADGIYLATYAALLLNLKLVRANYYESDDTSRVHVTEGQFVEEVHGSGVLVYLSATWLSELYQQVLASNLLAKCGYDPRSQDNGSSSSSSSSNNNNALVNALIDVDGMPGTRAGGQLLSDYLRLERVQLQRQEASAESEAGAKLARRVLTCCWASVVHVLASGLNPQRDESLSKGLLAKDDGKRLAKDTITLSLEGLQRVASLSNVLGLQSRCGAIFSLLAKAACSEQLISRLRRTKDVLRLKLQNRATNLHTSHATSMDVLLSKGLELSSHGSDCWPHVFTCCLYVSKLEHDFFGKNQQNVAIPKSGKKEKKEPPANASECKTNQERLKLSFNMVDDDEDDACVDVYSFLSTPYTQSSSMDSVAEIIQESNADNQFNGILPADYAAKIVCALSQQVDRLFEDAALKLNLRALCLFLQALCRSSKDQLFKSQAGDSKGKEKIWWRVRSSSSSNSNKPRDEELNTLLLSRLGEVMLKCVKSGRPLIHAMRAWSILGPHFMEAACHKDRAISKKAVECIYDSMAALLNDQLELPHFHFNEALFKPFENLLCLELCDPDVQDQIVSCICEFVETNRTEIRSGWRPLFGALKVATVGQAESVESAPLLEVFRVFLSTDNPLVFANAALDCILCLLKHVRGCSDSETTTPTKTPTTASKRSDKNAVATQDDSNIDKGRQMKLCLESLKYLASCSELLANMYRMPACPIFHSAQRMQTSSLSSSSLPQYVDPSLPEINKADSLHDASYELLLAGQPDRKLASLQSIDQPSGILRVWYSLIEGLASATMICPRAYQPHALETLFHLLRGTLDTPGPPFGLYCVNHLLLPMVQNWLRKTSRISRGWDSFASNFKQCCGLTTDLVVDFIDRLQGPKAEKNEDFSSLCTLMIKQLFLVMTECIVQPTESIARLGCACIRHVLVSSGPLLTAEQWEVCGVTCHRACSSSLQQLHQLTMAFSPYSESFYGDAAQVKVAARRDATAEETERLRQLAAQVFLLEEQRREELNQPLDEKSYVFQLYSPSVAVDKNPELFSVRIQMRALIVGLLVHQMLLQCIATVLLQNANASVPRLPQLLMKSVTSLPKSHSSTPTLEPRHVNIFLSALDLSYVAALKFDSRPGLKFLLQKVANLQRPANLYHQACTAWTIKIVALFDLCLSEIGKCGADLKQTKKLMLTDAKSESKFKRLAGYMTQLRTTFDELCGTYVDIALDRDGRYTVADTIAERKFFLLVSQPDDYTELPDEEEAPKNNRVVYNPSPENEKPTEKLGADVAAEQAPRPFRLSDLASDYSTDSGPQSEPESDDSRPETPSDLNDSQIVFLDRHREAADKTSGVEENETTTTKEVKKSENNATGEVESKKAKRRKKKRGSDDCLLSRRYNLKFIQKDELESYAKKQSLYFRSKSMLELHRSAAQRVSGETTAKVDGDESSASRVTGNAAEQLSNEEALEDIAALIKEYEHNKRGFSTNPFLQDERRKTGSLDLDDYCKEANKDSETRRRAWAETIGTSLEFALALSDEQLAPLLPALVGGIRVLTRHAYELVLKQHLSVFYRRVGQIYGLVDAPAK